MARKIEIEQSFSSTTWTYKRVKMSSPPEATETARAERAHRHALPVRDARKPLNVVVRYRGGPECWWQIEARGTVWRFPGYVSLEDALSQVNRTLT